MAWADLEWGSHRPHHAGKWKTEEMPVSEEGERMKNGGWEWKGEGRTHHNKNPLKSFWHRPHKLGQLANGPKNWNVQFSVSFTQAGQVVLTSSLSKLQVILKATCKTTMQACPKFVSFSLSWWGYRRFHKAPDHWLKGRSKKCVMICWYSCVGPERITEREWT